MEDLVAIARVAKPRGIKGEVTADILTDFPERFDGLAEITAIFANGKTEMIAIESHRFHNDRVLLKFAGIDDIESAEKFRNAEICVSREDAVELDEDEFFDWELEGCRVVDINGVEIGTVSGVMRTGGTENLIVDGAEKEYLIPFAEAICVEVDLAAKLIKADLPDGLLDL